MQHVAEVVILMPQILRVVEYDTEIRDEIATIKTIIIPDDFRKTTADISCHDSTPHFNRTAQIVLWKMYFVNRNKKPSKNNLWRSAKVLPVSLSSRECATRF